MGKGILIVVSILLIIILVIFIVSFVAEKKFDGRIKNEVTELWNINSKDDETVIDKEDLAGLPTPVQKWLEASGVVGKERINAVRMKQQALMRLDVDKPWMPADIEQYFTVDKPGFIWKAHVKMAPFLSFSGEDKYYQGKGSMQIKVLSLVPVVDASGPEIDQSTMIRYLGEMIWFPTAALSDYLEWEEIDEYSAKVTMNYQDVTASGTYYFNEQGDIVSFKTKRYMEKNGQYTLEDWGAVVTGYREINGLRIPYQGDIIWYLETGDYHWYHYEISELDYNKIEAY